MKHTIKIEIRFVDIDVMGHVNNAVYLNYFEQARMHFFAAAIGKQWDWINSGILLARNEIDYVSPTVLMDELHIETSCTRIGNKSMDFEYVAYVMSGNERVVRVKGKSIIVCYDYMKKQTIEVPEMWREKLK
ncbi:MAG: acyl-CoA thioesterase [Bacteroidota bacterium]